MSEGGDSEEARLISASARQLYGAGERIWDPRDRWNSLKSQKIDEFGARFAGERLKAAQIGVDVGCGSDGYGWIPADCISIDRFESQVAARRRPVVASVEALPLRDSSVDFVVCVGAVLNYVSAAEAISEIARVTMVGGELLLHFESSSSFEHAFTRKWGAPVVRIDTQNSGRPDTIWVFRPEYIYGLLRTFGFVIRHKNHFHIGSALGLRLGLSQQAASGFAKLDRLLGWFGRFADDVILLAEKVEGVDGAGVASVHTRRRPAR